MNEFEGSTEGSEFKRVLHQRAWKYVLDIAGDEALAGDRLHDAVEALTKDKAVDDEALWEVPADLHVTPRLDEVFEMASQIELETPAEPTLNSITDGHQYFPGPDAEFTVSVRATLKMKLTVDTATCAVTSLSRREERVSTPAAWRQRLRAHRRMRRRDHTRPPWRRLLGIGGSWSPLKSGVLLWLMFLCSTLLCSFLLPPRAELERAVDADSVPWYVGPSLWPSASRPSAHSYIFSGC